MLSFAVAIFMLIGINYIVAETTIHAGFIYRINENKLYGVINHSP